MDVRQLTYFIEVAKNRSFTKASGTLHVSQPSLSKMVKSLEVELNIELLDRSGRQIELTDAGEIVFDEGQIILESLNKLSNHLYDLMDVKMGQIKVGVPPLIGMLFFPKIIKNFHNLYPNVDIKLFEHGANKVQEELSDGLLDLGVVLLPVEQDEFDVVPFVNERMMLFVHTSSPFATRESVEMEELKNETFLLFSEDFSLHDRIKNECMKAGFNPTIAYESSQWDFIIEMVGENIGISIFPPSIAKKVHHPMIRTIPIVSPSIPWNLGIITKKGKYVSHAARAFINNIIETYQN